MAGSKTSRISVHVGSWRMPGGSPKSQLLGVSDFDKNACIRRVLLWNSSLVGFWRAPANIDDFRVQSACPACAPGAPRMHAPVRPESVPRAPSAYPDGVPREHAPSTRPQSGPRVCAACSQEFKKYPRSVGDGLGSPPPWGAAAGGRSGVAWARHEVRSEGGQKCRSEVGARCSD